MTIRETHLHEEPTRRADPAGNERLTAMTGTVLLVLFVAECLTLLNIGNYLTLHVFLGMLLLGPVGLKICSTWRSLPGRPSSSSTWPRTSRSCPGCCRAGLTTPSHLLAARPTRWLLLCGSLVAGLALAFATYHLSAKFGGSPSIIP